jgi:TM2 domain-containing membrane protein YozV
MTQPAVAAGKNLGIAYLFLFLLGIFSAHRFYLGRYATALAFNFVLWFGWILTPGTQLWAWLLVAGGWLIFDIISLPHMVRTTNAKRFQAN